MRPAASLHEVKEVLAKTRHGYALVMEERNALGWLSYCELARAGVLSPAITTIHLNHDGIIYRLPSVSGQSASQLASELVKIDSQESLEDACRRMLEQLAPGVAVVNRLGECVGVVTPGILLPLLAGEAPVGRLA